MTEKDLETHQFQAEVKQVLDIVVNSLYTDREIFIRELVSNASDALEKLRHIQLTEDEVFDDNLDLEIEITTNQDENTITIRDFGVGMSREELVENLGTIAHSGSKDFLRAVREGAEKGAEFGENLIGQFGVGFYSVFMVADSVEVYTHNWKKDGEHLLWRSDGLGGYEIENSPGQRRGCKIIVHLKDEAKEFAEEERVKHILKRYSSFVQFPIKLNGEQVNTIQALWTKNKNEIDESEYNEFYKFQGTAFDEPFYTLHFSSDAPLMINALLFVPEGNIERWGFRKALPGVNLYCKKVLIDSKPEGILPEWLRFLKGVIDSADLPLNISRETMQDSALVKKLNDVITKRFLKFLEEESEGRPEKYREFYNEFGVYLKEGVATDFLHRDQLSNLLRFDSSSMEKGELTSLPKYVSRMKDGQQEIYYLLGPDRETLETGPHTEAFKVRDLEVLYLYEPVDEFVMSGLGEFDGKSLVSADNADIDILDVPSDQEGEALSTEESAALCDWIKNSLGERVNEVRVSRRLVESPALALNADKNMTPTMRRVLKASGQDVDLTQTVNLEINSRHELIKNLAGLKERDSALAELVAEQIFDNAMIAAGFLEDFRPMVNRVYKILEKVSDQDHGSVN